MDTNYIVIPLVGAIIGYFTNWLAIKMLFRPHKEKKVFGVKLPFTPGIIPKGRYLLSKKASDTVSEHVLTKDVINDALVSLINHDKIETIIDGLHDKLKADNRTLEEFTAYYLKEDSKKLIDYADDLIKNTIKNATQNQHLKEEVLKLILDEWISFLKNEALKDKLIKFLEDLPIKENLDKFFEGKDFEKFLRDNIENLLKAAEDKNLPIKEYIAPDIYKFFENFIYENTSKIADILENHLDKNPETEKKLDALIQKTLEENVSKIALVFVSRDKLYENAKKSVVEFLRDKDNLEKMNKQLLSILDTYTSKSINDYVKKLPKIDYSDKILNFIETNLKGKNLSDKFLDFIILKITQSNFNNIYDIAQKHIGDLDKKSEIFISEKIDLFLEKYSNTITLKISEMIKLNFWKLKTNDLVSKISTESLEKFKKYISENSEELILKGSEYFSKNLNISKIMEEQINKFSLDETEKIITSVINRELSAITILGGFLGLLIGILTVIIQNT